MLLRRFQHNCGCARTLQKSWTEARNRMEKINIELAGIPLELTLRYKMFRDRYADFQTEKNPAPVLKSRRSNAPAPHAVTNRERFPKALKILNFAPRPAPRFFRTGGQSFMRFASCGAERHGSSALRAEWEKQRIISSGNAFSRMKWKC